MTQVQGNTITTTATITEEIKLKGVGSAAYTHLVGMPAGGGRKVGWAHYEVQDLNTKGELVYEELAACDTFVDNDQRKFALWASMKDGTEYLAAYDNIIYYKGSEVLVPIDRVGYRLAMVRNVGFVVDLMIKADFADGSIKTQFWKQLPDDQRKAYFAEATDQIIRGVVPAEELPYQPFAIMVKRELNRIADAAATAVKQAKIDRELEEQAEILFGKRRAA